MAASYFGGEVKETRRHNRISSAHSSARLSRCSAGRIRRSDPVLDRYARITFEKSLIVGHPKAELVAPGHPLLEALVA